jgi:hypothetical protein
MKQRPLGESKPKRISNVQDRRAETFDMLRDITTALLNAVLLFWALTAGPFCWILRDGLGPNSVDSHGAQALLRFLMTYYWGPVLLALVVLRIVAGHFPVRRPPQANDPTRAA